MSWLSYLHGLIDSIHPCILRSLDVERILCYVHSGSVTLQSQKASLSSRLMRLLSAWKASPRHVCLICVGELIQFIMHISRHDVGRIISLWRSRWQCGVTEVVLASGVVLSFVRLLFGKSLDIRFASFARINSFNSFMHIDGSFIKGILLLWRSY